MRQVYIGREHSGPLQIHADVVVVGSGAGGSVIAAHLAEAGQRVVVLEEGGYVSSKEHADMRPSQSLRHVWREAGLTMAVGLGETPMINVMMGRCVGGSSALTGGVCFRIPENVLAEWNQEHGLTEFTQKKLEPFYKEVEANVHVEQVPIEMQSRSTQLFAKGAKKLGYELKPMRRNTKNCTGWSSCNFGCPQESKLSVLVNYLPRAEKAGAAIYSDCLVEKVIVKDGRAAGVKGRLLNREAGRPGDTFQVSARRVVLSAGAYYTPLILKKSNIGRRSKELGRNLTLHPAFRVMAKFDDKVEGWSGAMQSAYSSDFEPQGIQLNSIFVPAGILVAGLPGVASEHLRRAQEAPHLAIFGVNLHDKAGGRVQAGFGREPFVSYRMAKEDRARVPEALRIAGNTFFAAGAKEVYLPMLGLKGLDADEFAALELESLSVKNLECTSQHPLGTCRMGTSPNNSVVDPWGQSWEVRDLFIADGSTVPTSLGVNPQLTIMTMSTRTAHYLRDLPF